MRYWYGYTGESLILGHGRTIRQLVDMRGLQRLLEMAVKQYESYESRYHRASIVPKETFVAAMIAPLAVLELGIENPPATRFSSAGQVLKLFDGLNIEQVAINLFNDRIASAYAAGDITSIATRITQGFDNGDFLFLPRDAAKLHTQEIINTLPGALVFLLSRSHAERKAFSNYLRRGTPPVMSADTRIILAKSRPVLRTWEREAHFAYKGSAI